MRLLSNHAAQGVTLRLTLAAACLVGLSLLVGCGDGRPTRVPISGRVTIDGEPLTTGRITIIPSNARPASGDIGPDGRFTLNTFEDNDGAVLGKHKVTVLASEILSGNSLKWHAPKEYADLVTTDLEVEITGPTEDLLVELSWNGGKPFVEKFDAE